MNKIKISSITVKFEKIKNKIRVFKIIAQSNEIWEHPRIWKLDYPKCYSEWFHKEIKHLKANLIEYMNGNCNVISAKYNYIFFNKLSYGISEFQNIKKALFYTFIPGNSPFWSWRISYVSPIFNNEFYHTFTLFPIGS